MNLSTRILGTSVVDGLTARSKQPILTIGSDRFRRADLAGVGCFNFIAANHLQAALKAIGARSLRDVFEHVPPSALVLPGMGSVSLAVLGAAFEAKGIGGSQPLEAWAAKHRAEGAREFVTFSTLKTAERKRSEGEARARKRERDRRHARRDKAQRLRVDRFTSRHEATIQ